MSKFIFTCEHGGNYIPEEYSYLFEALSDVLASHKGWDIGILSVAKEASDLLKVDLTYSEVSRLLVELNRSIDNPDLFSNYTELLDTEEKQKILNKFYLPYRNKVENQVKELISQDHQVTHISFHSFTPVLNGQIRDCDIGLLFDPARNSEVDFCKSWKGSLESLNRNLNVKYNYPYLGIEDGFTTYLRRKFPEKSYAGIELEVNQKLLSLKEERLKTAELIKKSLQQLIDQYNIKI